MRVIPVPRTIPAKQGRWKRRVVLLAGPLVLLSVLIAAIQEADVAPRVLATYVVRRAEGHSSWITLPLGWVGRFLIAADWSATRPALEYPDWVGAARRNQTKPQLPTRVVGTADALRAAIAEANPGDRIEMMPGKYRFSNDSIDVGRAGTASAPITVAAATLGEVTLQFELVEGFLVRAPYWRFENLVIQGTCKLDADCEHAFHVVGPAVGTVIRNNLLLDFNAHIKVNGHEGQFPDHGVIDSNTLIDTHPRMTDKPVTPIDLVAASDWNIHHNLIADFIRGVGGAEGVSYGGYAKGGGENTNFDSNVVLCEYRQRGFLGKRVGLSLGGGGSAAWACRDGRCTSEYYGGALRNNLIAYCSDDGIYLNRASRSEVVHNTVIDTAGITVRFVETTANFSGNLFDGTTRVLDQATVRDDGNRHAVRFFAYLGWHPIRGLFRNVSAMDLRWSGAPPSGAPATTGGSDLCGQTRPVSAPVFGAFENIEACSGR